MRPQGRRQPLQASLNPRQILLQGWVCRDVHAVGCQLPEPLLQEHPGGIAMRQQVPCAVYLEARARGHVGDVRADRQGRDARDKI